jgi:spore coat polysaccharide biosynthesis protein SpsF
MGELLTVLTARVASARMPGKMLLDVDGKPLIVHVVRRLSRLPGRLVLATTTEPEDDELARLGKREGIPVFRGAIDDVAGRIDGAAKLYPGATFVLRALGDCPFLALPLVERAVEVMAETKADAFLWHLAPDCWPVYGAREFPYSRAGWDRIARCATGDEREHPDLYFHRNRSRFRIAYHEPLENAYFRNYRLEVDWPEDLVLVRRVAKAVGMLAPLPDVTRFLDGHPKVAALNRERVEATGPLTSYEYGQRRAWMKAMRGQPVHAWDGAVWRPPTDDAQPVFCKAGTCLIGFGCRGVLHTKNARIRGAAFVQCGCGVGRTWREGR